jgi:catechol 2,3-dioxygenase-like lactoylglutathione lyase family enzyme
MLERVSHVTVYVANQDEAVRFYVDVLGFGIHEDIVLDEFGGSRWLTVVPPGQPDFEVLLFVPGLPAFDEDTSRKALELMALGAMPTLIFETPDCRHAYETLTNRGVAFTQPPMERLYGIDAAFRDPFGNQLRMTQRTGAA